MKWWYAKNDQKIGPVEEAEFRALVQSGVVTQDSLVWNETMPTWTRAGQTPGLFTDPPAIPGVESRTEPSYSYQPEIGTPNATLMALALDSLRGRWGLAIGVVLLLGLLPQAVAQIPCVGVIAVILATGALQLGQARFFLAYARREPADLGLAFSGFSLFGKTLVTYLLMTIFVLLWMLLLIIPGLIKSLSYAMSFYILSDHPDIEPMEAIDRSMAMMDGNKWKLFCLGWRFFGWAVLCILTCGIGFIWLLPYMTVATAHFYEDVKRNGATTG